MSKGKAKTLLEAMTRAKSALTEQVSDDELSITVNLLNLRIALLQKELSEMGAS